MKQLSILSWFFTLFLFACQSSSTKENREITEEDIARTVEATHIAEFEVEGMTCEMGCGGDIRKALRHTGGVAKVDFDFQADREVNVAKVHFDAQTIDLNAMKRVIEELNKGQFQIHTMDSRAIPSVGTSIESSSSKESGSGVQMKNPMISLSEIVGRVASWFF